MIIIFNLKVRIFSRFLEEKGSYKEQLCSGPATDLLGLLACSLEHHCQGSGPASVLRDKLVHRKPEKSSEPATGMTL